MSLTQSYEPQRDLLIGQLYKRSSTTVASGQATRYQKAHQRISVGSIAKSVEFEFSYHNVPTFN